MCRSSSQTGVDTLRSYAVAVAVQAQLTIEGYSTRDQMPFGGDAVGESAVMEPEDAGK